MELPSIEILEGLRPLSIKIRSKEGKEMAHEGKIKTIWEPAREIKVAAEADVVVVGGGPGGHSAAVAAARSGANTILIERYGHLGGMATGGIVIQIPHLSDGGAEPLIAGLCLEWLDRLEVLGGSLHPRKEEIGSEDPEIVRRWRRYWGNVRKGRVVLTAWVDPELLKCVLNDMAEESNVRLLLHSWATSAIVEGGKVKGVILESKSGRCAVLGKVIIDGTGDGDLLVWANADYEETLDPSSRSSTLALVFRLGNCNYARLCEFRENHREEFQKLLAELHKAAGARLLPLPSNRNDVMWINNWIPGLSCLKAEDLTSLEVKMRKVMLKAHKFLRENMPGFEESFIMDTAPQVGTRGSRRVVGEYVVRREDILSGKIHPDTIAIFPIPTGPEEEADVKYASIPFRALVPRKVDGLLVAGRSFSSDPLANDMANLIPHCIAMGQAAGTAAAIAVEENVEVRNVPYGRLREKLLAAGARLGL